MKECFKTLKHIFDEAPLQYGLSKTDTLLEALYQSYCEGCGCDSVLIIEQFRQLNDMLRVLSIQQQDQVIDLACKLCSAHHKEAYKDGLIAGFRLYRELSHDTD